MNDAITNHTADICYVPTKINSNGIFAGDSPLHYSVPTLLLQTVVVVSLARLIHFVLSPISSPFVVAEIIGGIILGPSVLGHNSNFSSKLFPTYSTNLIDTISRMGLMYFIFIAGVKVNPSMVFRMGRKQVIIAVATFLFPLAALGISTYFLSEHMGGHGFSVPIFQMGFLNHMACTAFPVLQLILSELNLLSSKFGRIALYSALINDTFGLLGFTVLNTIRVGMISISNSFKYLLAVTLLCTFIILVIRPAFLWIIRNTPEGKPVNSTYTTAILLGVLLAGFVGDVLGANIVDGPVLLGLVVPHGPPLGLALVEKMEALVQGIFMPLFFASCGLKVNVFSATQWKTRVVMHLVFFLGVISKVGATMLVGMYSKMPTIDSFTIGLIMIFKGELEIAFYVRWRDLKLVDNDTFAALILSTGLTTAVATPWVKYLSKATKLSMNRRRRLVPCNRPKREMRIVACVSQQDSAVGILNLLEAWHPTKESPITVYLLHLVELLGRATPMLVPHRKQPKLSSCASSLSSGGSVRGGQSGFDRIVAAFENFEQQRNGNSSEGGGLAVHPLACIAPYTTIHEDICHFSVEKKATLVLLPYHKKWVRGVESADSCFSTVNPMLLAQSTCSVGVLLDRGARGGHRVGMLFFGGPDDREALACSFRFVLHPAGSLKVVRFLAVDDWGDDGRERRLDDDVVEEFLAWCDGNKRVEFREVRVRDGEDTLNEVRAMDEVFDVAVVGLKQVTNTGLVEGLSEWSEHPDIGPIGDLVTSSDFFGHNVDVLVIRQ